jgi:hypothetical protein
MNPRFLPQAAVFVVAVLTLGFISFGWDGGMTWPLFMFLTAKYAFLFAVLEIALSLSGYYKESKQRFAAGARTIAALGMAISLMLLISIYEIGVF